MDLFGSSGGFREFLSESGQERGPPSLRSWDGRDRGAVVSITAVSEERAEENNWSSWVGEGVSGGGGISQSLSLSVRPGQSASCQRGVGLSLWGLGGRRVIKMGASSDPVEGRDDASQERNAGNICG